MNPAGAVGRDGAATMQELGRIVDRRRALRAAMYATAALTPLVGTIAIAMGGSGSALALAMIATGVAGAAVATAYVIRSPTRPRDIARHLDRRLPDLEESAELLTVPGESLGPLAALQRDRVTAVLQRYATDRLLPDSGARAAFALLAGSTLLTWTAAALLEAARAPDSMTAATAPGAPRRPAAELPRVDQVEIAVRPPAYTRHPARQSGGGDLTAESGAEIAWRITTTGPVAGAWLLSAAGDSVALRPDGDRTWAAATTAREPALYAFGLRSATDVTTRTDYHRLDVIPDEPPLLTIVRPEQRTVVHGTGSPVIELEALARDDYGVDRTRIVATMTQGSGESIKFREDTLLFDQSQARGDGGLLLRRSFDLRRLGMGPGDELYFHVLAWDRHPPVPNLSRSETAFITWADTSSVVVADASRIVIDLVPEYFRSQRQIIIDTEKLIEEKPRLSGPAFVQRSNDIGIDQKLLRLRYGQFLGEEFEASIGGDAGHGDANGGPEAGFVHRHDTAENATLFAPEIKAILKASVAQMWEAELRLRTGRPEEALPFERRALELLKDVQQRGRTYVKRVGFEPPPIEADKKRLSGKLSGVADRTILTPPAPADSLASIRTALERLQDIGTGLVAPSSAPVGVLEAAGVELARLLLARPGRDLAPLGALRSVIDSLTAGRSPCAGCVDRAASGLWQALPEPEPRPFRRSGDPARGPYFRALRALRAAP